VKTIALLAILCLAVGGYVLLQHMSQEPAAVNQAEGSFPLTAHTVDELSSIQYTKDEVDYHFVTAGSGSWQLSGNPAFPLDSDAVQTMAESLVALTATRKLTDGVTLADYGLDEPTFTVTASWSDGTKTTYAMGSATPFADGYYLYLTDDAGTVYTVATSLSSTFSKTLNTLAVKETIPTAEHVTRIVIGNALDAVWQDTAPGFDPDQHWMDSASGTVLDGTQVDSLISAANGLTFSTVSNASPTAEELAGYQLTEDTATTVTLYSGEEAVRTVLIGAETDSGSYYATLPGSTIVYTLGSSGVSSLLNATAESLTNTDLMSLSYANLAQAVFSGDGISYTLVPQPAADAEEETDEEESDDATEADPGEALWAQVCALTCSDMTEAKAGTTLLTMEVTSSNGLVRTLTVASYDVDHYQISVDGAEARLIGADSIDRLIRTVKSMQ